MSSAGVQPSRSSWRGGSQEDTLGERWACQAQKSDPRTNQEPAVKMRGDA